MDPDIARARLLEQANLVLALAGTADQRVRLDGAALQLAETVHALDEWLRMGGFLPSLWTRQGAAPTQTTSEPARRTGGLCSYLDAPSGLTCALDAGHYGDHDLVGR